MVTMLLPVSAAIMAQIEDQDNAVECGWATGNTTAYQRWRDQYAIDRADADALLEALDHDDTDDARSEYGGGSAYCSWYDLPGCVLGIPSEGDAWIIPNRQHAPKITRYREKMED